MKHRGEYQVDFSMFYTMYVVSTAIGFHHQVLEVASSIGKDFCLPFYWLFYLFTFQMLSPFLVSPPQTPYPIPLAPCLYEGASLPTHPLLPYHPSIPLHWGIKSPQDQGPHLLLMPD